MNYLNRSSIGVLPHVRSKHPPVFPPPTIAAPRSSAFNVISGVKLFVNRVFALIVGCSSSTYAQNKCCSPAIVCLAATLVGNATAYCSRVPFALAVCNACWPVSVLTRADRSCTFRSRLRNPVQGEPGVPEPA